MFGCLLLLNLRTVTKLTHSYNAVFHEFIKLSYFYFVSEPSAAHRHCQRRMILTD